MRSGTLSRTRIFRADPDLDAAVAAGAARQGVPVSAFLRDALRSAVVAPPVVSRPYSGVHAHVPAASIPDVWPEVSGFLAAACARPGCDETPDTLRAACEREQAMLLLLLGDDGKPAAAGVFQIRNFVSGRRTCWVLAMGGRPVIPWREWLAVIEARARSAGCGTVEFVGRRGWQRVLPHYTAEPCETGTYFSRAIGH